MHKVRRTLKKYFVPHEENDHKPQILRPRSVAFVLLIALAVEGALWFGATRLEPNSRLFGIIVVNSLIDETNQNRVMNNEPALAVSPLLTAAAQDKVNDMVANNYFAHTSPTGVTPWYWFEKVGYGFTYAGENLAVNFFDSQDVTNAWMNSAEHRANILDSNFTQIGMAAATGTYQGHSAVYVVELFGAPIRPAPPAEASLAVIRSAAAATAPITASKKSSHLASASTSSNPTFAAVKGVETSTAEPAAITTTVGVSVPSAIGSIAAPTANPIQRAVSDPRAIANDIYLAIIAIFTLALGINIFMKIRVQHAQVILGGMIVIIVTGLLIVLNQHALAGTAIL